jgi:hypothetical protein
VYVLKIFGLDMKRVLVNLVLLVSVLASAAVHADEARLWIVEANGPGNLSDCPAHATRAIVAPSARARLLTSDAKVRWEGGSFRVGGETGKAEELGRVWDNCFALMVDGQVITAGAILLPFSARLLRFPVLQLLTRRQGEPLIFELNPGFPASLGLPIPEIWRDSFSKLH